jgi:transglutaminase-like putative cysteine protease
MTKTSPHLTPQQSGWLLAVGVATIAPLAACVELWLIAASGVLLGWRSWLLWRGMALPPRWLLFGLAFAGCAGVFWQFRTLLGQNPGVALLILFIALKQLESRTARDGFVIIFLALFLALSLFFYTQAIPAALASAASIVIAIASLLALADRQISPPAALRQSGVLLLQAAPLMLVLFVLFPRIQGPLWALPRDANSAVTGLADSMSPGSISELSQLDDIAFRTHFPNGVPLQKQLYWRALVLSEFDGRTWRPAQQRSPQPQQPYPEPETGGIDYEMMIEPHGRRWLFALEMPSAATPATQITRDFRLFVRDPITTRQHYRLRAFPNWQAGVTESPKALRRALALPEGSNPRIRALAAQWRQQAASDDEVLQAAESFFRKQRLLYTLMPPVLGEQTADEFLFDTRQGFCEHFANACAVAMRAAGIPARVVAGYQGGEVNPVDGWLTVYQYDAHAWVEVWLPERGWLRIDPTAISAPTRIDLNLAAAVPAGDPLPMMMRLDLAWLRDIRFRWEAIANTWNQWVLGYNVERQHNLLRRLGMPQPDWQHMTATMMALAGLAVLTLTAWILYRRQPADPVLALWNRLSRRLARKGLARRPAEGPLDYAQRIGTALPHLAADIKAIAKLYARQRYGAGSPQLLAALRRRVTSFRPG